MIHAATVRQQRDQDAAAESGVEERVRFFDDHPTSAEVLHGLGVDFRCD